MAAYRNTIRQAVRLGYVPLLDAAPIIIAQELGHYAKWGLHVDLSRELGWASIRDKIVYRDLDAAHALGAMPLAATLGIGSIAEDCVTGLILSSNGNGITLSTALGDSRDPGPALRRRASQKPLVFGIVFPSSSHHYLMKLWLRKMHLEVGSLVRLVVLPPHQVRRNLTSGTIDGYCVGEPWNTLAVMHGEGYVVALSSDLAPGHPEKVLMTTRRWAEENPQQHLNLIAAITESCAFCSKSENYATIASILARPEYLDCPAESIMPGLTGLFDRGTGGEPTSTAVLAFEGTCLHRPDRNKAEWFREALNASGLLPTVGKHWDGDFLANIYREDLFEKAKGLLANNKSGASAKLDCAPKI